MAGLVDLAEEYTGGVSKASAGFKSLLAPKPVRAAAKRRRAAGRAARDEFRGKKPVKERAAEVARAPAAAVADEVDRAASTVRSTARSAGDDLKRSATEAGETISRDVERTSGRAARNIALGGAGAGAALTIPVAAHHAMASRRERRRR